MSTFDPKVIVALDFSSSEQTLKFVESVSPEICRLKIGKELFTSCGPELVKKLVGQGFDVFLDLKFHDIPNTVNKAVAAACQLGVWMLNVHALGGREMMLAAKEAVDSTTVSKVPKLIAVSVLTSTNQKGLNELGINKTVQQTVIDLTGMSLECGLDGMVCSAKEAEMLRKEYGPSPILVTPGIRPSGAASNDQQRIMTPAKAMLSGSSYLVIGRPITLNDNPQEELRRINDSLKHR
ncbi:MAG: orotidine-5'-phosphate decarboxylase [Gammaproteobacteria bacterium]|jgi:orotidine-5'-phosphate decarboxylase|nr:orotidine-5'-phosphate decarboxylase [Gammaproteobacteria bacterium]MBT3724632.1 orotidine-5'-phosphate decarboxylase [Gammaproteobacteria bacterium]MBT4078090.1 orotidine-5'-phosphate decarboxylase [Gammaproteobacteria bacterium]MBT4194145.1 orotidine-5'-phosphate decarboxylase [Gammaproteobacteria bacterium]MBT4451752.1 orotidine-5'-phosphate decarboxylase [Gammaproteobacteria bacterium]